MFKPDYDDLVEACRVSQLVEVDHEAIDSYQGFDCDVVDVFVHGFVMGC